MGGPVHHARQGLARRRCRSRPTSTGSSCAGRGPGPRSRWGRPRRRWRSGRRSARRTRPSRSTWTGARRSSASVVEGFLERFSANGVRIVRLDAVGYLAKRAGTSCFCVQPETDEILAWLDGLAERYGMALLPEVHAPQEIQLGLAAARLVDLRLHPAVPGPRGDSSCARRLASPPISRRGRHRQFTMLDCHDGVPVKPDLDGLYDARRGEARRGDVRGAGRQPEPHPVAGAPGSRRVRRPPDPRDLLLAARLRRRRLHRRPRDPALRARHPADLLRGPPRRRERPGGGRADRRRPGGQPAQLQSRGDPGGDRSERRPAPGTADPASQLACRVRRQLQVGGHDRNGLRMSWATGDPDLRARR